MRCRVKWVVLWSLWAARLVRQPTAPVRVSSGWVRGSVASSGAYAEFLGIPYATIVDRFQAPGPEPKWDGIFEAINDNVMCKQTSNPLERTTKTSDYLTVGQDGCLILNVYKPLIKLTRLLPVMVYVHGGAFFIGFSSKYKLGPEYFISKEVILVTFNYRLHVEGFLCLGIKEAPGNAGLKDQVAALKWVQRNIKRFGGDPDNVTIFGQSAGAVSVSLHILSPMSRGLFHKAIALSGSSLTPWAIQVNPIETAFLKAKAVGYTDLSKKPHDLYLFFRNKTSSEIITHLTEWIDGNGVISRLTFVPCIENIIEGVEPFLTELPYTTLIEGRYAKIPIITGVNSKEGCLFFNPNFTMDASVPRTLDFLNVDIQKMILNEANKLYENEHEDIRLQIQNNDFPWYLEDVTFYYSSIEEADLLLKTNDQPIYKYNFSYDGRRNIVKLLSSLLLGISCKGATHADEIFYMFSQDLIPALFENRMIEVFTTLFTNFAKYGDPTPAPSALLPVRWPALQPHDQRALRIDRRLTTIPLHHNNTIHSFWRNVYAKYRRNLTDYLPR